MGLVVHDEYAKLFFVGRARERLSSRHGNSFCERLT
jgi:hypothetical protein